MLGLQEISWLGTPALAFLLVMAATVWWIAPFPTIMLLGGLHSIDPMYFDAATVDGATPFQMLRNVTLPLIFPVLGVSLIWLSYGALVAFDLLFPLTAGGPGRATEVLGLLMYNIAFLHLNFSEASAILMVLILFECDIQCRIPEDLQDLTCKERFPNATATNPTADSHVALDEHGHSFRYFGCSFPPSRSSMRSSTFRPPIITQNFSFRAYLGAVQSPGFFRYLGNSVILSVTSVVVAVAFGAIAAYGFTRYAFKWRHLLLLLVLLPRLLPRAGIIIPLYMLFANLRLLNTYTVAHPQLCGQRGTVCHLDSGWFLSRRTERAG